MDDDVFERLAQTTGFEWDDGNAPKVRDRHSVEPGECEQAFFGERLLVAFDRGHSKEDARWQALGRTTGGRLLFLVFTLRNARIRVLAARDMNRKERRTYEEATARAQDDPGLRI